jgi:hypothetical protein
LTQLGGPCACERLRLPDFILTNNFQTVKRVAHLRMLQRFLCCCPNPSSHAASTRFFSHPAFVFIHRTSLIALHQRVFFMMPP